MNQQEYRRRRYEEEFKPTYNLFISLYPFELDDLDGEVWLPIPDYDDYQESNYGRTKSFKWGKEIILKPVLGRDGYLRVNLSKGGNHKTFKVSRLVATLFIPNPDNKPEVNHIYSRFSNHVDCLEWATGSENVQHAFDTGLAKTGEDRPDAKLTNEQVLYIRENPEGLNQYQLADMFGIHYCTISAIQRGKIWKQTGGTIRQAKFKMKCVPKEIRAQIRAEYKPGVRGCGCTALAKKYGVTSTSIWRIIHEKN